MENKIGAVIKTENQQGLDKAAEILSEPLKLAIQNVPVKAPVGKMEFYNNGALLEPFLDYTDSGQSHIFVREFGRVVRYVHGLGYIVFDGTVWKESYQMAAGLANELTERQKEEAGMYLAAAYAELAESEKENNQSAVDLAKQHVNRAKTYMQYVLSRRSKGRISASLAVAQPMIEQSIDELNRNPYLLNTPVGTINLETGEIYKHNPDDFCTKITGVSLSDAGRGEFQEFLKQITCGDAGLSSFLQELAGLCAIGRADEHLWIPFGSGGNGKTALFELLRLVLGEYGGGFDTGLLVQKKNFNATFEKVSLLGKRFVIASELGQADSEVKKLDSELMKQIITTGTIQAAKKGQDSISFMATHTTVLLTNTLPVVVATDGGTWGRLRVVPFNGVFRDRPGEVREYHKVLFEKCGGAVLAWIVEGAARVIANNMIVNECEAVKQRTDEYRKESDSVYSFIADALREEQDGEIKASEMNGLYKKYCKDSGKAEKGSKMVKEGLAAAGHTFKHTREGGKYFGLVPR